MDEKLKSTLDKVIRLTQQNVEFDENLRKALNANNSAGYGVITDQRLDEIYEYCIEKIIRKQAEEFYSEFPVKSIIPSLIEDFTRMESFRRRDNFGDFCLALYQQIEGITNKLCENAKLSAIAEKMWGCSAYVDSNTSTLNNRLEPKDGKDRYTIAQLVFPGQNKKSKLPFYIEKSQSSLQALYANDKIRAIIYFVGYRATMKSSDYGNYIEITSLISDVYQCRNMNHRGTTPSEWEATTLNKILPLKSYYYFKFTGALAQFVSDIKKGYGDIPTIEEYCKTIEIQKVKMNTPNVLGKMELSPEDLNKKGRWKKN